MTHLTCEMRRMAVQIYNIEKKTTITKLIMTVAFIAYVLFPIHTTYAEITDGYYEIDYEVLNADSDAVSVADEYFEKPASLIIEDGKRTIQASINHSQWVVGLQAPDGEDYNDVEVLSEDEENDLRIVQFDVEEGHDFADPIELKMHIVVDILDEEYDHHYTARFLFDEDSLEEVNAPLVKLGTDIAEENEEGSESPVDNSEVSGAGVNAGTLIVIILLVGIAAVLLYSFVFKKRK